MPNGVMPDSLIEIKPTGKTTGEVVWEWHLWDHLVQDHDKAKANYGTISAHPELVDLNFGQDVVGGIAATPDGVTLCARSATSATRRIRRIRIRRIQISRTSPINPAAAVQAGRDEQSRLDALQLGGL